MCRKFTKQQWGTRSSRINPAGRSHVPHYFTIFLILTETSCQHQVIWLVYIYCRAQQVVEPFEWNTSSCLQRSRPTAEEGMVSTERSLTMRDASSLRKRNRCGMSRKRSRMHTEQLKYRITRCSLPRVPFCLFYRRSCGFMSGGNGKWIDPTSRCFCPSRLLSPCLLFL